MKYEEFIETISEEYPPSGVHELLKAMWLVTHDEWSTAHRIAQENESLDGSLVHAYLHRVEGDKSNALYWYSRAGKTFPGVSLEQEWDDIVRYLVANL